jgi:hypothetical protein
VTYSWWFRAILVRSLPGVLRKRPVYLDCQAVLQRIEKQPAWRSRLAESAAGSGPRSDDSFAHPRPGAVARSGDYADRSAGHPGAEGTPATSRLPYAPHGLSGEADRRRDVRGRARDPFLPRRTRARPPASPRPLRSCCSRSRWSALGRRAPRSLAPPAGTVRRQLARVAITFASALILVTAVSVERYTCWP